MKSTFRIRLGAVVLNKNRIIARGFNKTNYSHPDLEKYKTFSLHAEHCALLKVDTDVDTLVVVRIRKNGELACSKPCETCSRILQDYNIKNVVYIDEQGQIVSERVSHRLCA